MDIGFYIGIVLWALLQSFVGSMSFRLPRNVDQSSYTELTKKLVLWILSSLLRRLRLTPECPLVNGRGSPAQPPRKPKQGIRQEPLTNSMVPHILI